MVATMNVEKFIEDIYERPVIWNRSYSGNKPYLDETWTEMSQLHQLATVQLKAKWKGLRDMFRVEYKRIPRDDSGELIMEPYEFASKWIYYKPLLFLVDHMRSRGSHKPTRLEPFSYEVNGHSMSLTDGDQDGYGSDATPDEPIDQKVAIVNYKALQPEVLIKSPIADTRPIKKRRRHHHQNLSLSDTDNNSILYNGGVTIGFAPDPKEDAVKIVSTPEISISAIPATSTISSNSSTPKVSVTTTSADSVPAQQPDQDGDYHFLMSLHPYMTQLNGIQKLRVRTKFQNLIFKELYDGGGPDGDYDAM